MKKIGNKKVLLYIIFEIGLIIYNIIYIYIIFKYYLNITTNITI